MQIKKHSSKNEYIYAGDMWVRNFTKKKVQHLDINMLFVRDDFQTLLENENKNSKNPRISDENIVFRKIVIVCDGHDFATRHKIIQKLPKDVAVLAVNGAMKHWTLMSSKIDRDQRRSINGYIINNPYSEAKSYLPGKDARYFPTCVASERTNYQFIEGYAGDVYTYEPASSKLFGRNKGEKYKIDDYRNPICAAIGLSYQFGVRKLMLMCCDDSFEHERDFAVQLDNGLWTYPHHLKSQEVIDANLYWLTHQEGVEVDVCDYSSGREYVNATYINDEDGAIKFFVDREEPNES